MPRRRGKDVAELGPGHVAASQQAFVLQDFLPYRLSVLAETVSAIFARRYEERFGLSIPEWRVMAVLGEASPRSTQQVIDRTGMDRVRVSRAVIRLSDKGLLHRHPQANDQRAHMLSLSPGGRKMHGRIVPLAQDMQCRLAGALSAVERTRFERILAKLLAEASDMVGPHRVAAPPPGRRRAGKHERAPLTKMTSSGKSVSAATRKGG